MSVINQEEPILTITENGYGKRSPVEDYRQTHRGGKGVKTIVTNERNGKVIFVHQVSNDYNIILTTQLGMIVRIPVEEIKIQGRNTMGVRVMRLNNEDSVVSVTKILGEEETSCDAESEEVKQDSEEEN